MGCSSRLKPYILYSFKWNIYIYNAWYISDNICCWFAYAKDK